MLPPGLLPEGLRDLLPPAAEAEAKLAAALMAVFSAHGHARVSPPLVEYEATLGSRLASPARRELLRFTDPVSQHTLALRSDITGQVGRIACTRMAASPRPLRLSYCGPVLRVRGDQLSPERQSLQTGVEIIGADHEAAALAVLRLAVEALATAGIEALSLDLTLPDLVAHLHAAGLSAGEASLATLQALLDGKDIASLRAAGAAAYEPLIAAAGPAATALPRLHAFAATLPEAAAAVLAARLAPLSALVAALDGTPGLSLSLDPTERHGFEYQSWLGFSLFGAGLPSEIGRGGSYSLVHPDGRTEPAIGFSLYLDSLVDAGFGSVAEKRLFCPPDTAPEAAARLRAQGWTTVTALAPDEDPAAQRCTHVLVGGTPQPLTVTAE
ncbi:ATP phosphoribosyltransferase regulatory subunit [Polymorphobacter sp.]|uniref:ATP phosphoribosyltransferase regulatory subunit n=1 Tax=Polymorphobacter sp. TaxID=1909290 RepID=UPI003F7072B9